ncbi:type III secretion system outer membrane ring subunit SctC [Ramlibacter sp. MAHUQ-53]|uniref:type III secretion system outer membrane ring subunit SctC n=1 Tax=unclassified Ramlibacter TaxID=2617605 RepID=UPI003638ADDA
MNFHVLKVSGWSTLRVAVRRARVIVAWMAACAGAAHAGPVPWPDAPYSYFANNVSLESVLGEFASGFSLSLSLQPGVAGTVNGRFTTRNPTEFISRLGGVYGFSWFTHAGTLHVSRASDAVTRSLPVPSGSQAQLRQALGDLGVLDARFGWGELPDQGIVLVSGPPAYVGLIEATLRQLPPGASAHQVMVFRLRHASSEDRLIQYRDRQVRQAGLATVLRNLVGVGAGASAAAGGVTESPLPVLSGLRPSTVASESVAGVGASSGTAGPAAEAPASRAGAPAGGAPAQGAAGNARGASDGRARTVASIQSDPRLNALVIHDIPERMPMYERLIAQLDVPTALIEIEAMIIDINTERARELGINWSSRRGDTAAGFGVIGPPAPGTLSVVRGPSGGSFNSSTLAFDVGNHLIAQIRLLENRGDARIQSRPSVLTTDNIGALLDLSETFYIRVQGERVATVSPVTAGTTLRVTPRLVDGVQPSIQLTIDIEDGQIQDRQVDSLPTVRRSVVSTQAIVQQDEALLIAGYSSDQAVDSDQKVPLLGDLPGVGLLFSNKTRVIQKRERLFMIRPKLVTSMPPLKVGGGP